MELLKQLFTTFFFVLIFQMNNYRSLTNFKVLMRIFGVKTTPTFQKGFSMVIKWWKNTSILTASTENIISTKSFNAPLFQNWCIYLSMCSLSLIFVKKLLISLLIYWFISIIMLSLDYLIKWLIWLDFTFFSFYDYLCMFHQPAKICSRSYNNFKFHIIIPISNWF